MKRHDVLVGMQLGVRAGIASVAAASIAGWLELPHPIYAMIAAVIVTDLSPERTRALALPRLAGTLLGAGIGAFLTLLAAPGAPTVTMGIGVALAMFLAHAIGLRDAARLAGYVCGIVLLDYREDAWAYAGYRVIETVVGLVVAVLVSLVPKLTVIEWMKEQAPRDTR